MTLLLADDDLDDCQFFEEAFQELYYQDQACLHIFNNGEKLLNYLRQGLPDPNPIVVFLDMNMPVMNGTEFLRVFAQEGIRAKFDNLKIVIYSTSINLKLVDELITLGVKHYIRKPYEFEHIKQTIAFCYSLPLEPATSDDFIIELTS